MTALIIFGVYIAMGMATAFLVARFFARKGIQEGVLSDGEEIMFATLWGILSGLLWPFAIAAFGFYAVVLSDAKKNDPTLRKRRLDERERRIRDLERELRIR